MAKGTVFRITPEGTLTTLVSFTGPNGSKPQAELVIGKDGNFYGTTFEGGSESSSGVSGYGTVFRITPEGALTTLVTFAHSNGGGIGPRPGWKFLRSHDFRR